MERYELGREAAQQIALLVKQELMRALPQMMAKQQASNAAPMIYVAETGSGGISALSGDTPGSATVALCYIDDAGDIAYLRNNQNEIQEVTAYNLSESAVQANVYIQLKQEVATGKMLVDFENCPPP